MPRAVYRHVSRRTAIKLSGAGLLGSGLLNLVASQVANAGRTRAGAPSAPGKAKACILLFQVGGPYQCDTFDPKPNAPAEVRGPYKPIATNAPGVFISEAMPQVARHADKFAIVRSVHHLIRCHNPAIYCSLAGREATDPMAISNRTAAQRTDHPHYASVISKLRPGLSSMPRHVVVPDVVFNGPAKSPGILGGYLGASHDPFIVGGDPSAAGFHVEGFDITAELADGRLQKRQALLGQLEGQGRLERNSGEAHDAYYREAFSLLTSSRAQQAFELDREKPQLRDRYGRHSMGQSTLLARRLVESGVPFVTVFSHTDVDKGSWDTHREHDRRVKEELLPPADQSFSALLEDLSQRGMLDEVLVVWMGEFGRTPRMGVNFSNNTNNVGGRDHWCNCYSAVLAGGGVRGGQVVGASDRVAGYPKDRHVHISDLAATVFFALGVDPRSRLVDIQGQQRLICDGQPVHELF